MSEFRIEDTDWGDTPEKRIQIWKDITKEHQEVIAQLTEENEKLRATSAPSGKDVREAVEGEYYGVDYLAQTPEECITKAEVYLRQLLPHDAPSSARKMEILALLIKLRNYIRAAQSAPKPPATEKE